MSGNLRVMGKGTQQPKGFSVPKTNGQGRFWKMYIFFSWAEMDGDIVDILMICLMIIGFQPWFASPCSKDLNLTTFSTDT